MIVDLIDDSVDLDKTFQIQPPDVRKTLDLLVEVVLQPLARPVSTTKDFNGLVEETRGVRRRSHPSHEF